MKKMLDVSVQFPHMPGKRKNQLISLNNITVWYRYGKTAIKNDYKKYLKDWIIPQWTGTKAKRAKIVVTILRHTKRKFDSDNAIFGTKWFIDSLVESGWLEDDDQMIIVLNPSVYIEGIANTMLNFKLYIGEDDAD